jgi:hypothetical protein
VEKTQLTERDLSATQRSVIGALSRGATLHTGGRLWLDTGFEAGVSMNTFYALIRKGLIRMKRRRAWGLSTKGRLWAQMPWNPRRVAL